MRQRPIVYVCTAIKNGSLLTSMIESNSLDDSYVIFEKENGIKPQSVLGPFYKKRTAVLDKNCEIKFNIEQQSKKVIYNGWYATAMILSNPINYAYLFYDKRIDGKKSPKPNLTIVNVKDLQDLK